MGKGPRERGRELFDLSRFLKKVEEESVEHDVSKELFWAS